MDVGQGFAGDSTNYLNGPSALLDGGTTGKAGRVVVRALPDSVGAGKYYLLESDANLKFLSIYCDGGDGKAKVDWYPNGDATIATQDSGVACGTDWLVIAVAINNVGTDAKIDIEIRRKGAADWETLSTNTLNSKSLSFSSPGGQFIRIGKSFTGTIHSLEITTSDGSLAIDKAAINGWDSLSLLVCDPSCKGSSLCIENVLKGCTECSSAQFLHESVAAQKLGQCNGRGLIHSFNSLSRLLHCVFRSDQARVLRLRHPCKPGYPLRKHLRLCPWEGGIIQRPSLLLGPEYEPHN